MTARQVYEYVLIELGKINAPALKLYEFNYLFNKAINQYINTIYTKIYDLNQLATDDLRVLKSTAYLTPTKFNPTNSATLGSTSNASSYLSTAHSSILSLNGATYEAFMPLDYLHLLNCICIYRVNKTKDCYDAGSYIQIPATRLTADSWATIVSDVYNRPTPMNPYYYLHNQSNIAATNILPQSPITSVSSLNGTADGIDMTGVYQVTGNVTVGSNVSIYKYTASVKLGQSATTISGEVFLSDDGNYYDTAAHAEAKTGNASDIKITKANASKYNFTLKGTEILQATTASAGGDVATTSTLKGSNFPRTLKLDMNNDGTPETEVSLVEKPIALRAGNPSTVRLEIRYGKDDTVFLLVEVLVDYVKTPQNIRLTQEQIDLTEDTSQIMEFPDYVCQEIINGLVTILMLRNNDPKIQSKYGIDQQIQQAVLLNQPAMAAQQAAQA